MSELLQSCETPFVLIDFEVEGSGYHDWVPPCVYSVKFIPKLVQKTHPLAWLTLFSSEDADEAEAFFKRLGRAATAGIPKGQYDSDADEDEDEEGDE